jgi:hypothetical protein
MTPAAEASPYSNLRNMVRQISYGRLVVAVPGPPWVMVNSASKVLTR